MHAVQARLKFEALFTQRQPTRDEMFMRPDFRMLAASAGMSFGECWDTLVNKAKQVNNNIELAAAEWYAALTQPRL